MKVPKSQKAISYTAGWFDFKDDKISLAFWKDGKRFVRKVDFNWYFFLSKSDFQRIEEAPEYMRKFEGFIDSITESKHFWKIYLPFYSDRRKDLIEWLLSIRITPLEADVGPVDRYVFDNSPQISTEPKLLYFDLETDGSAGWEHLDKHKILSIAFYTKDGVLDCYMAKDASDESERELLEKFFDQVEVHDVLVGWNTEAYDEQVIRERAKYLGLKPNWRSTRFFDLLQCFKRYYMRDETGSGVRISFSLDNIAKTVLGKGKTGDVQAHKMLEIFKNEKEKLAEYNKRDVEIMVELEQKFGYIQAQTVLAAICNRFLSDAALRSGYLVDGFILSEVAKRGDIHFGLKRDYDKVDEDFQIQGAYIMDPIPGMYYGICDLDFSSLYPSVVISFNISPDTKIAKGYKAEGNHCEAFNGIRFRTDNEGVFPKCSIQALKNRQEFKDKARELEKEGKDGTHEHRLAKQRSDAWKVLANSMYGILSSQVSRYFDPECGEAITIGGKTIIQRVISFASEKGLKVVYSDTDSVFLHCSSAIAQEFADSVAGEVGKMVQERRGKPGLINLKLDAEFERIFFTAKKRYAGKKTSGIQEVRGLELVRSDGCKMARELQRKMITFLMEVKNPSWQMAEKIVMKTALRLFGGEAELDELKLAQTLTKNIVDYPAQNIHVRIAKQMVDAGKEVYIGMKIPYVITGKEEGRLAAIHADEFAGKYDAKIYWKSKVYPPTQRVVEAVFPEQKEIWASLEDFEGSGAIPQVELFEKKEIQSSLSSPVVLVLKGSDREKFETLRAGIDEFKGSHPLKLEIQEPDEIVTLKTEIKVRLCQEFVTRTEEIVGHKTYYGKETWD